MDYCPACLLGLETACITRHFFNEETGKFMSCIAWDKYQKLMKPEPIAAPVGEVLEGEFSDGEILASEFESDAIRNHVVKVTKERGPGGGRIKAASELRQPARVGRQRANLVKPIKPGDRCEWSELKFAGGGIVPIVGCYRGAAATVHHGPDKDYLNNTPENLHKICTACHSAYHKFNDRYYVDERPPPGEPFLWDIKLIEGKVIVPHDTESKATLQEIYEQIAIREKQDPKLHVEPEGVFEVPGTE